MWIEYAEMELAQNAFSRVEEIFGASLLSNPKVELWSLYLDYLRRIHPLITDTDGSRRKIISQAFDLLLETVGIDPDSGKMWRDYVDFVKSSSEGTIGGSGWQNQQKTDFVRAAYQRAIKIPHAELTRLWKEYDNFELTANKTTGRRFLQEQSPHYMQARSARTQVERRLEGIDRSSLPILPPLYGYEGEDEFGTQVEKWRAWIQWEKDDPLVFKDDDIAAYRKRVLYVYKQATMHLRFYPQMWFEAAGWCFDQGTAALKLEGDGFLDGGMKANPESVLLATKKADRIEGQLEATNNEEAAIANGKKVEPPYNTALDALYAQHKKIAERKDKAIGSVKAQFAALPADHDSKLQIDDDDNDDEDGSTRNSRGSRTRAQQEHDAILTASQPFNLHLETLKRTISGVWVAKLRAFRRLQGQGKPGDAKKGFRGVFTEARPRGCLTSEVYIANALMEWYCYHDQSAKKIFERGLKLFPTDEGFALEYMRFLSQGLSDAVNCRGVFETVVGRITNAPGPEKSGGVSADDKKRKLRALFSFMHSFESEYGDLQQIQRIEQRTRDLFPGESEVAIFSSRFTLPSFDPLEAQILLSPAQAQPRKTYNSANTTIPNIETPNGGRSPAPKYPSSRPQRPLRRQSQARARGLRGRHPTKEIRPQRIPTERRGGPKTPRPLHASLLLRRTRRLPSKAASARTAPASSIHGIRTHPRRRRPPATAANPRFTECPPQRSILPKHPIRPTPYGRFPPRPQHSPRSLDHGRVGHLAHAFAFASMEEGIGAGIQNCVQSPLSTVTSPCIVVNTTKNKFTAHPTSVTSSRFFSTIQPSIVLLKTKADKE